MTRPDTEILSAIRAALLTEIGGARFEVWFQDTTRFVVSGTTLIVQAGNPFVMGFLRKNLREPVLRAAQHGFRAPCDVNYEIVDPAGFVPQGPISGPVVEPGNDKGSLVSGVAAEIAQEILVAPPRSPAAEVPNPKEISASSTLRGEHPGRSRRRPYHRLDQFAVGPSNELAVSAALECVASFGTHQLLIFHGSTSVGKSHLLEGIYREVMAGRPDEPTLFLSADEFTSMFVGTVRTTGMPNLRRKFRGLGLFILDDVHLLATKRQTCGELLHTLDCLLKKGSTVVLAMDRAPNSIPGFGPELSTRFSSGLVCPIGQPDEQVRLGIISRFCLQYELNISIDIQRHLANKPRMHARSLEGTIKRMQLLHRATGRPIDIAQVDRVVQELCEHSVRPIRIADVERAVCGVLGLEPDSLRAKSRSKSVNHPRMLAMWLARQWTSSPHGEIGRFFGGRSHSAVVSAQKQVTTWLNCQAGPRPQLSLPAAEAIRRVEEQLWAG